MSGVASIAHPTEVEEDINSSEYYDFVLQHTFFM
jgi:hypothetical protein